MTTGERMILSVFRNYGVKPQEMLFINSVGVVAGMDGDQFTSSMNALVNSGLVCRDRRKHAYHLTQAGYNAMLQPVPAALARQPKARKLVKAR